MFAAEVPRSRAFTTAQVVRSIRRHPRSVFWRCALLSVVPSGAKRHPAIVDFILVSLDRDPESLLPEWIATQFPRWKWKDAARVAAALKGQSDGPAAVATFLSRIAASVDDRTACLLAARAALDACLPNDAAHWAATTGLVLVQQDPAIFMKRLRLLAPLVRGAEFVLYRWAVHAAPGSKEQARVRRLIASLPDHRRDCDGEVSLAVADGDEALRRRDPAALRESLRHLLGYVPGARFSAGAALDFLVRASSQHRCSAEVAQVLKALLPTEVGARAEATLRRRESRR